MVSRDKAGARKGLSGCGESRGTRGFLVRAALRRAVVESLEPRQLLSAYTLKTLADLSLINSGDRPNSIVLDAGGNLFAASVDGGTGGSGVVFELPKGGGTLTNLAQFDNAAGSPGYLVADGAGNLYGVASGHGSNPDYGLVFEIAKGSTGYTTLAKFNGFNGEDPTGLVIDGAGNLYGTAATSGAGGVIYEVVKGSGTITDLASLNGLNVSNPYQLVMDSSGNLFGTTFAVEQAGDHGAVFEVSKGSRSAVIVARFNSTDGADPRNLVIDPNGNIFGTTASGGASGNGTVFEIPRGTGTITDLVSFNGPNGSYPVPLLLDGNGNLFGGTAYWGPDGQGIVFEIPAGSRTLTTLASFNGSNGSSPIDIRLGPSGTIYGVTDGGGAGYNAITDAHGSGTVFELSPTPASIAGSVFNDVNRNHVRDAGETGLGGWTVYADLNANGRFDQGEPSAITTSDGSFQINGVPPGTYTLREVLQAGYVQTAPSGGANVVTVDAGSVAMGIFGDVLSDASAPTASVSVASVTTASTSPATITVTYSEPGGWVKAASVNADNLAVKDGSGTGLNVIDASIGGPATDGPSLTVNYTIAAPANGWAADAYTIALGATPVTEIGGLAVASLAGAFNPTASASLPYPRQFGLTVGNPGMASSASGGWAVRVTNSSGHPLNGTLALTLYAWPDASGGGELGAAIGTVSRAVKFKPGASMTIKVPAGSIHPPSSGDAHYLLAGATLGSAWGNSGPLAISATPPIDLSIHSTIASIAGGKNSVVPISLANVGKALAKGAVSITAYASASATLDSSASQLGVFPLKLTLKPGQSHVQRLKLKLPTTVTASGHYLLLKLGSVTGDTDAADKIAAVPLT